MTDNSSSRFNFRNENYSAQMVQMCNSLVTIVLLRLALIIFTYLITLVALASVLVLFCRNSYRCNAWTKL